jgi:hypothetical protein
MQKFATVTAPHASASGTPAISAAVGWPNANSNATAPSHTVPTLKPWRLGSGFGGSGGVPVRRRTPWFHRKSNG